MMLMQMMQSENPQYQVFKYGDERDGIVMQFNMLQVRNVMGGVFFFFFLFFSK